MDLFGNIVETKAAAPTPSSVFGPDGGSDDAVLTVEKNISNTAHDYILLNDEQSIQQFINTAMQQTEIMF